MKSKQLETIKERHTRFINAGKTNEPSGECDLKVALVSSNPPKLKTYAEIVDAVKHKLVCERYRDSVGLEDIFKTPANSKKAEWEKAEKERMKRVVAYRSKADEIVSRAELTDDADANEVMAELVQLAKQNGLYE